MNVTNLEGVDTFEVVALSRAPRTLRRSEQQRGGLLAWLNRNTGALQALAALTAIPIGMAAAVFALMAFRDQQQLNRQQLTVNRDQLRMNRLANDRFERRYASRVAWWPVEFPIKIDSNGQMGFLRIAVQNRSPAPLRTALVRAALTDGGTAKFSLGDIRPCEQAEMTLTISTAVFDRLAEPEWSVVFRDPEELWKLNMAGDLSLADVSSMSGLVFDEDDGHVTDVDRTSVSDCGESG